MQDSGCMVRLKVDAQGGRIDGIDARQTKTDEKVQTIEISFAKIAGALDFLKWAVPIAIAGSGIIATVITRLMG